MICWKYMCPSSWHTTYGDAYFSSFNNTLSMNAYNAAIPQKVPNLSRSVDSRWWNNSMPCGYFTCSNFYPELLCLEESNAGAHVLIQVFSAPFGQHKVLLNITNLVTVGSFLPVCVLEVNLVPFYVHWLEPTSNSCIHTYCCWYGALSFSSGMPSIPVHLTPS